MDHIVPTPRFVTCFKHDISNGNIKEYIWDKDKISVTQFFWDDLLMLQNVFEGRIISSSIYPLIYETKADHKEISLRSLEFYREVERDHNLYESLSKEDKIFFLVGIRDLFIAACRKLLTEEEKSLFQNIVNIINVNDEDDLISKKINNLNVTPYPTCKNKLVRFLEHQTEESLLDECFIRNECNLLIGFIDPRDLSFHNFENIINLNSIFDENYDRFKITNFQKCDGGNVYTFDMKNTSGILKSLDKMELYTPPLNKLSRGGERFVFSSDILSKNLSICIKKYIKDPSIVNSKFQFINYVFRYNKFRSTDKKFSCHYDTPYHDPKRKHYSKYTLLLYLTSGIASPVLDIDHGKVQIHSVELNGDIKGIIFDQKYEHEGQSYIDGDKIFMRSELIYEYEDSEFNYDNEISKRFNVACYMTKQSIFNSEVEKYSSECFNQAAKARVSLTKNFPNEYTLVYKMYENVPFITNGYDYWFRKNISLKDAAVLVILDYFNCKLQGKKCFNRLTYQQVISLEKMEVDDIFLYLKKSIEKLRKEHKNEKEGPMDEEDYITNQYDEESQSQREELDMEVDKIKVSKETEQNDNDEESEEDEDDESNQDDDDDDDNSSLNSNCCPKHARERFYPFTCPDVLSVRNTGNRNEQKQMDFIKNNFTVYILDKKIEIDKSKVIITDNLIRFKNEIPGFNFANSDYMEEFCWTGGTRPKDFVLIEKKKAKGYNLPSIPYLVTKEGYHLKIEMFNSNFVRKEVQIIRHYTIVGDRWSPNASEKSSCDEE